MVSYKTTEEVGRLRYFFCKIPNPDPSDPNPPTRSLRPDPSDPFPPTRSLRPVPSDPFPPFCLGSMQKSCAYHTISSYIAYRDYISIASINSNRRGWSRRIIFCKIPNGSKNFDRFFITPRSFLLFISNLHCLIKQLKNHAIGRKPIFRTIFAQFLKK